MYDDYDEYPQPDAQDTGLPPHIHAELMCGRDPFTGSMVDRLVVWADRPYRACPMCGQHVTQTTGCPAILDLGGVQGGRLQEISQQHGCGQWLAVDWADADPDDTAAVAEAVAEVSAAYESAVAEAVDEITARLRVDLADALAGVARGDVVGDVTTGSETEPGVYAEYGELVAWDYDPRDPSETITVQA